MFPHEAIGGQKVGGGAEGSLSSRVSQRRRERSGLKPLCALGGRQVAARRHHPLGFQSSTHCPGTLVSGPYLARGGGICAPEPARGRRKTWAITRRRLNTKCQYVQRSCSRDRLNRPGAVRSAGWW
jgi:hypothetical protein